MIPSIRRVQILMTSLPRAAHRRGFGVQSPWAYELVRDVLFEPLAYYAYRERHLRTPLQRQLFRIRNHFRNQPLEVIDSRGTQAAAQYEEVLSHVRPDTVLVVEHTHSHNARLWRRIVKDPRATVTFDMGRRGMVVFDPKRIKQNYLL